MRQIGVKGLKVRPRMHEVEGRQGSGDQCSPLAAMHHYLLYWVITSAGRSGMETGLEKM